MTATLRGHARSARRATDPDLETASRELATALIDRAPSGCEVAGIAPAGSPAVEIAGLAEVRRSPLARRELAGALQLGVASGIGGGMIHSPTLFAPLVKHDRVHDHDQTVVTIWDLGPWEARASIRRRAWRGRRRC